MENNREQSALPTSSIKVTALSSQLYRKDYTFTLFLLTNYFSQIQISLKYNQMKQIRSPLFFCVTEKSDISNKTTVVKKQKTKSLTEYEK